jgi:DDE superfamily endonuclease
LGVFSGHYEKSDPEFPKNGQLSGQNLKASILVCDNLNTHNKGALYQAFNPQKAKTYVDKIQFCYTPKHGSWLNVAECELSCLTRQCSQNTRLGSIEVLSEEISAWSQDINSRQRGVDWQMTVDIARTKLKSLYPTKVF